jgi:competence protein ComEC
MNAHFINVGQGAAVLLEFACGAALIDTGGEKNESFDGTQHLTDYLDAFFRRRSDLDSTLAMVILSHPHIDHTRGLPLVMSRYTVELLVDNGQETGSGGRQQKAAHRLVRESRGGIKYQSVSQRETDGERLTPPAGVLRCAGTAPEFRFLWGSLHPSDGWSKEILKDQNNSSVVTRLAFGRTTMLFPGDLEEDVQSDLIESACASGSGPQCLLDVDIYHVAHHGSHNGTMSELVEAMTPRVAVISMGAFDRQEPWSAFQYGHPRNVAIDRLLNRGQGVKDTRGSISAMVAERGKPQRPTRPATAHFIEATITQAIYGTGWADDDTIVVAAKSTGTWSVLSQVTP